MQQVLTGWSDPVKRFGTPVHYQTKTEREVPMSIKLHTATRVVIFALIVALAIACTSSTGPGRNDERPKLAPITNQDSPAAIRGQYIVVFREGTARARISEAQE